MPDSIEQLRSAAMQHYETGQFDQAAGLYREILSVRPSDADAMHLLGLVLYQTGRTPEAVELLRQSIVLSPSNAAWYANLGEVLRASGRYDDAIAACRRAVELGAGEPGYTNLANALAAAKRFDEALDAYATAMHLAPPTDPVPTLNFVVAASELGQVDRAADAAQRALPHAEPSFHTNLLRLRNATILPAIYETVAQIEQWRTRLTTKIAALRAENFQLDLIKPPPTLFNLAYQGMNDRDILRDYSKLMRAPHVASPPGSGAGSDRIRVGFISEYFREHTVGAINIGLVERLNRQRFEVVVLSIGDHRGEIASRYRAAAEQFAVLPPNLDAARRMIATSQLDIAFYTDIGIDSASYALASSRLAPVQCVTWGHPSTTGIPTVDYFISSDLLEPTDGQDHYTERLFRLRSLGTGMDRPRPPQPRDRAHFNLPASAHLYGCLQMLYKFHPDFDELLAQILRRDRDGLIVIPHGRSPAWTQRLAARFQRTMPDVVERVRWVSWKIYDDYMSLSALCDVMLVPLHFGAGKTTYEAIALAVPSVTLPSRYLRGRITLGLYRAMGVDQGIAASAEDYVQLAVAMGTDHGHRQEVSRKIRDRGDTLFDCTDSVRDLEECLAGIALKK